MPNDMYQGKLREGMSEDYPHHVYLRTVKGEPGQINMSVYFLNETIKDWIQENCKGGWEFRKDVGDRPEGVFFANPPMTPVLCFKDPDDAFAFKMRWVGDA